MAFYKPDYKLEKAAKLIADLDNSEESELIRYYIKSKQDYIDKLHKQIDEYQSFFRTLHRFTKQ